MSHVRRSGRSLWVRLIVPEILALLLLISWIFRFGPGLAVGENLLLFSREMVAIIPAAFVLVGLFEVWVPKNMIERHLGAGSGVRGYLWAIVLASGTVGGLYVSFPVASALAKKGAGLGVVFAYVGLSGILRVPMTLFEISFLGIEFSLIRYIVSIPLVIGSSYLLGTLLEKRDYRIHDPE